MYIGWGKVCHTKPPPHKWQCHSGETLRKAKTTREQDCGEDFGARLRHFVPSPHCAPNTGLSSTFVPEKRALPPPAPSKGSFSYLRAPVRSAARVQLIPEAGWAWGKLESVAATAVAEASASGSASFHKSPGAQPAPAFQASPGPAAAVLTHTRRPPPPLFPPLTALPAPHGALPGPAGLFWAGRTVRLLISRGSGG